MNVKNHRRKTRGYASWRISFSYLTRRAYMYMYLKYMRESKSKTYTTARFWIFTYRRVAVVRYRMICLAIIQRNRYSHNVTGQGHHTFNIWVNHLEVNCVTRPAGQGEQLCKKCKYERTIDLSLLKSLGSDVHFLSNLGHQNRSRVKLGIKTLGFDIWCH